MTYTQATDLVIDPICGSGDVLVEAVKADRMAIGFEYEKYWVDMARARIERTTDSGRGGFAAVVQGTVDTCAGLVKPDCSALARLVLTAPQTGTVTRPFETTTASDLDEFVDGAVAATLCCKPLLAPSGVIGVISWAAQQADIAKRLTEGFIDAEFALVGRCMLEGTPVSLTLLNLPDVE